MQSVGELLKGARLEQGKDLTTVAALTKINAKYLRAIEADDRQSLPSAFFYKSFVHQYAKVLGLETVEIDQEVDRLISSDAPLPLPGQENSIARDLPPMTGGNFPHVRIFASSFGALVLMLVACSAVYMWWHQSRNASEHAGTVQAAQTVAVRNTQVAVETPPPPPPNQERKETEQPVTAAPVAAVPAATGTVASAPNQPAASAANIESIPGVKVLLDLVAREATWLSVSSDGKNVFTGMLAPNESKKVEGKEFAKLRVGNAGGVDVRLNGKFLGALGGRGQVLTVIFTPDSFQIVMPPKEGDD